MKISSVTEAIQSLYTVRDKRDAEGGKRDEREQGQGHNNDEKSAFEKELRATENSVSAAVEEFKAEPQAQANGLQATLAGNGPGLRVILKDGSGAIVRQFTGEEFLRLREAASREGSKRGKILDQKL